MTVHYPTRRSIADDDPQIVLVTGGGRGVGEMIAAGYVANGAKVSDISMYHPRQRVGSMKPDTRVWKG